MYGREQVDDEQREHVRVPGEHRQHGDEGAAAQRGRPALLVEQDEQRQGERHADGEIEHSGGHEPVVHHGPLEERGDDHATPPAERERKPRVRERAERQNEEDEQARGDVQADETADEEKPREEHRVGLEEPIEDELGVALRMEEHRGGREVVGQILQGRNVGQHEWPGAHDEEDGADEKRDLPVGCPREPSDLLHA